MTVPTFAKTWQFNVNQVVTATGVASTTSRNALFIIKAALISFATNPWTVRNSVNGTGAAPAGTDTWLTNTALIGAAPGTNHSWIQLRQTGIATNFELVIDCNTSSSLANATIVISPSAGFTGGTATARPTATDEIVLITTANWGGITTDNNIIVNVWQSTDGQCTRVITCSQSIAAGFWFFDLPQNPVTGWTNPSASYAFGSPGTQLASAALTLCAASAPLRGRGTGTFNMWMGVEGQSAAYDVGAITSTNDFDGNLPFFIIGVASVTPGARGRHANLFDMYMNQISPGLTGDVFPVAHPWTWALFGNIIMPWNDATPTIA